MGYAHTMKSRRHIARLIAASVLVVGTVAVASPGGASPVQAAPCTLCGGGEFHPLTPARIFDSRPGLAVNDVAPAGAKPMTAPEPATFDISLLGQGGIPADAASVLAVVVNITVTEPGAEGYLEAYGKGAQPAQHTSIVNFGPGQTVPERGDRPPRRRRSTDHRPASAQRQRQRARRCVRLVLHQRLHRHRWRSTDPDHALTHPRHSRRHRPRVPPARSVPARR